MFKYHETFTWVNSFLQNLTLHCFGTKSVSLWSREVVSLLNYLCSRLYHISRQQNWVTQRVAKLSSKHLWYCHLGQHYYITRISATFYDYKYRCVLIFTNKLAVGLSKSNSVILVNVLILPLLYLQFIWNECDKIKTIKFRMSNPIFQLVLIILHLILRLLYFVFLVARIFNWNKFNVWFFLLYSFYEKTLGL